MDMKGHIRLLGHEHNSILSSGAASAHQHCTFSLTVITQVFLQSFNSLLGTSHFFVLQSSVNRESITIRGERPAAEAVLY